MAYMSQEHKKEIAAEIKKAFPGSAKDRGFKYSLSVDNHSTIVLTISEGSIDFFGNAKETYESKYPEKEFPWHDYIQVNTYHLKEQFSGKALEIMEKLYEKLMAGNWDKSDMMTDYFNVGWHVDINIGRWNKPFKVVTK